MFTQYDLYLTISLSVFYLIGIPSLVKLFRYMLPAHPEPCINEPTIDNSGYVYLLRSSDGLYKIGHTKEPFNRLRTFKNKLPFDVEYEHLIYCTDRKAAERQLHLHYWTRHIRGEWFKLIPSDVVAIKSIQSL